MKISTSKPKIYDEIIKHFDVDWERGLIITYGDTVYCKHPLDQQKIVHEQVHIDQQSEMGVEMWWRNYFIDPNFRLDQELEAYKYEVEWIRANVKDRNQKDRLISEICRVLASPIYGKLVTYTEARNLLK